jgi:hypothetical protein
MSKRIGLPVPLAAALLCAPVVSSAAVFCVSSETALRGALSTATANAADDTIQIVRGSYHTHGGAFIHDGGEAHALDIEGGFNADCSARTPDPRLTVLDGDTASLVLHVESSGSIEIRYLTIQNGSASGASAGAIVSSFNGDVTIGSDIFRNNRASQDGGGLAVGVVAAPSSLSVRDSLLVGNSSGSDVGAASINTNSAGSIVYFTNNTVVANTTPGATGGVDFEGPGNVRISNSIFWGNSGNDLSIIAAEMLDNDYGTINVAPSGSGNVSVDPRFAGAGDYHLLPTSPLLGPGSLTPPGGLPALDIEGHARSYMNTVDLGAYERGDAIFDDGFD